MVRCAATVSLYRPERLRGSGRGVWDGSRERWRWRRTPVGLFGFWTVVVMSVMPVCREHFSSCSLYMWFNTISFLPPASNEADVVCCLCVWDSHVRSERTRNEWGGTGFNQERRSICWLPEAGVRKMPCDARATYVRSSRSVGSEILIIYCC